MERARILVVDDDDDWLNTIDGILGDRYQLTLTADASEAERLARQTRYALAILDQRLSRDVSGVDLLHRLREIQPGLRGIILTGFAALDDAVESMRDGAFDYLSKTRPDLNADLRIRIAKALEPDPLTALLKRGEDAGLEFKSSARWDVRQGKPNREIEAVVVKTVAGFLNSEDGGVLLIGVDDGGKVVGLRQDFGTLKRKDRDGFENFLTTLLLDAFGKDVSPCIHIDFHSSDGEDVCRVTVNAAPRAVFVSDSGGGEHLYIRTGNSTRLLSTREGIEYCKVRWK